MPLFIIKQKHFVYKDSKITLLRPKAFITPTAVIKQMNLLKADLGVTLFEYTHRGLTLTKVGKSLYQDTKYIIQYCKDSVIRATNAMQFKIDLM